MLPRAHRLRDAESFRSVVRRGRRAGSRTLVVHLLESADLSVEPTRVGLIVGKDVGPAVVRNRVKRRLRHLAGRHLPTLAPGSLLVVRALAPAAAADAPLGQDLTRCLASARERVPA